MRICSPSSLVHKFAMVDGIPRSGKSTLCHILGSMERVEIAKLEMIFEYVASLESVDKLERDAAIAMLRIYADELMYETFLGRNVNVRLSDQSSVFKFSRPWTYLKRMVFSNEQGSAIEAMVASKPIYHNHTHYQLGHASLHFDAHPDSLYMIELHRHPVDMFWAWLKRGHGRNRCFDPWFTLICLQHGDSAVPFSARGWEDEYLACNETERIIRIFQKITSDCKQGYDALSPERQKRVLLIQYEEFTSRPMEYVDQLAAFLDTRPTRATKRAIKSQHIPRTISMEKREKIYNNLKQQCDIHYLAILDDMIENYERTGWSISKRGQQK